MPPEAEVTGHNVPVAEGPPAASVCLKVLTKRADFLRAARAKRAGQPGLLLQARKRDDTEDPRVGYTCSKKIGNAVSRNRAKRRLREAARIVLGAQARAGWDYVLIGRPGQTTTRSFDDLVNDLSRAVKKVHA